MKPPLFWFSIHFAVWISLLQPLLAAAAGPDWYHSAGPLRGSLKSGQPLPLYDPDPAHLWNRVFAAFYIRPSELPSLPAGYPSDATMLDDYEQKRRRGELRPGPVVARWEGGDTMNLLAWPLTRYFVEDAPFAREKELLDEFIQRDGEDLIGDPLRKAFLQRDLWAVFDHLMDQIIGRFDPPSRARRELLCRKLALIISRLALPRASLEALPKTLEAAARSDYFSSGGSFESRQNYLPPGLLARPEEWVEIDTSPEPLNTAEKQEGQMDYVGASIRGRSYYRIFLRFPGGRQEVERYLLYLAKDGVDWEKAGRQGFMALKPQVKQFPRGTEAAIVQSMILLDDQLQPVPTGIVESVRVSAYKNVDGAPDPETNGGRGVSFRIYTGRRRLFFDQLAQGGLERLADDAPVYTVLINGHQDWGISARQQSVVQSCVGCHMHERSRVGVFSLNTIFCFFAEQGMPGIIIPLGSGEIKTRSRADRVVRWKRRQEDYLRLLEYAQMKL